MFIIFDDYKCKHLQSPLKSNLRPCGPPKMFLFIYCHLTVVFPSQAESMVYCAIWPLPPLILSYFSCHQTICLISGLLKRGSLTICIKVYLIISFSFLFSYPLQYKDRYSHLSNFRPLVSQFHSTFSVISLFTPTLLIEMWENQSCPILPSSVRRAYFNNTVRIS